MGHWNIHLIDLLNASIVQLTYSIKNIESISKQTTCCLVIFLNRTFLYKSNSMNSYEFAT